MYLNTHEGENPETLETIIMEYGTPIFMINPQINYLSEEYVLIEEGCPSES